MSTSSHSLFVNVGKVGTSYKVHPVVVLNVLDHFKRRGPEQKRVVGTLLGEAVGHEVLITNCFPIPHSEKEDQVTVDMEYHKVMVELHKRVNFKEQVVGWYSTGDDITYTSSLIHQVYQVLCASPVHLTVDTSLSNFSMACKAYVSKDIKIGEKAVMARFEHVKLEMDAYEAEKIGLDALINSAPEDNRLDAPATILSDFESLDISLASLLQSIETVSKYVDGVVAGTIPGDEDLGRAIADALAAIPPMDQETFDKMFNNNLQDLLMVVYLSNLTRTQLALADKIQGLL